MIGSAMGNLTAAEEQIRIIREAAKRRKRALALREKGLTLEKVGERLGVSKVRAKQLIDRAILERGTKPPEKKAGETAGAPGS